ncbi:hypothetical protein PH197_04255 [Leuconostoc lactis]|uniref:hypothetical protein n=1 Tax=Leuconostoc lactis TaxID=1246 RepID=UPI00272A091C|nr:hypothetical protein [Leuconostoc lactis]WKY78480.1 hypothetical protein PH197_04255 [Leuconostoc lactis]
MLLMKKYVKVATIGAVLFTGVGAISANTSHPAPNPLIDIWNYGTSGNYGWSNYYIQTSNYGSQSAVRNIYGITLDTTKNNYGWANSSANKSWYDVRIDAFWSYYRF